MEELKTCSDCGAQKPVSAYYAHPRRIDGTQAFCKACHNGRMRLWYKRNKEQHNAQSKQNYAKNPVKVLARTRLYQRAKRRAAPRWRNQEAIEQYYILARFLASETGVPWHVDHVVPLTHPGVCGLHVEHNLTLLPAAFNLGKGNKFDDWGTAP